MTTINDYLRSGADSNFAQYKALVRTVLVGAVKAEISNSDIEQDIFNTMREMGLFDTEQRSGMLVSPYDDEMLDKMGTQIYSIKEDDGTASFYSCVDGGLRLLDGEGRELGEGSYLTFLSGEESPWPAREDDLGAIATLKRMIWETGATLCDKYGWCAEFQELLATLEILPPAKVEDATQYLSKEELRQLPSGAVVTAIIAYRREFYVKILQDDSDAPSMRRLGSDYQAWPGDKVAQLVTVNNPLNDLRFPIESVQFLSELPFGSVIETQATRWVKRPSGFWTQPSQKKVGGLSDETFSESIRSHRVWLKSVSGNAIQADEVPVCEPEPLSVNDVHLLAAELQEIRNAVDAIHGLLGMS